MLCPSQQQPEPSTSKVEEKGKVKRKMATVSLGADHSGSAKGLCLSVQEQGSTHHSCSAELQARVGPEHQVNPSLSRQMSTFPRHQEQQRSGHEPLPASNASVGGTQWSHGPAAAASPVPASLPGLADTLSF